MSSKFEKVMEYVKNPGNIIMKLNYWGLLKWVPDEAMVKLAYRIRMGEKLDLENPKTLNQKIQWLKLYYRNPEYSAYVDKYEAKAVVEKLVGKEYVVPLIQAYDSFDDIDFDKLPNQFVLKTNHDSGGYIICKDKAELDIEKARKKMNKSLKRNYYEFSREWPYKNVKPKLFAEEYIVGKDGTEMKDYKIFCFDGEPKFGFVVEGRTSKKMKIGFFDTDFKLIPVKQGGKKYDMAQSVEKPYNFEKMLELAKILTKDMPFVRMDFIEVDDKLYVGEFTFYHWGGRMAFEPEKYDEIFGSYIKLPEKKIID